jgi:SanA protein
MALSPNLKLFLKKWMQRFSLLLVCAFIFIFTCNFYLNSVAKPYVYENVNKLPGGKYALLLGTSKYFATNDKNTFYQSRINAAFLLFKKRKVKKIIISGSAEKYYNEPRQIRNDLHKLGIPDSILIIDTNGVHTLESVLFMQKNGIDSVTVISQLSQVQRAIFLSRKKGIKAIGYVAPDPVADNARMSVREFFAKAKAVWDSWFRG